ncbi:MAG: radical SAM protein [Gemmatimonadetes bacterium]|nr:radical SAM protein [Gemmatimonadota bacterium]
MISSHFKPYHIPLFLAKYAWLSLRRMPMLVHFEVTMRCNARCGFCDYWKTPATEKAKELTSFADAARHFSPMMITFTGGEPLLRRDLEDLVRAVREASRLTYITLITHGGMLTLERARALWDAGIDQFNISLDYLDGRHDAARGIPGLTAKILATVQSMRADGIDGIRFNTVIKNDNVDQLLPIVERAAELGIGVNFSLYTDFKNGNRDHLVDAAGRDAVERAVGALMAYKRAHRGVITNSDHYLSTIPQYLRGELPGPCDSGNRTIHISPTGTVKRCPDFPLDGHWRDYKGYAPINCDACYYACRGEAQAPLEPSRALDMLALGRRRPAVPAVVPAT